MTDAPGKRSVTVAGHRTSLSLEDEFWSALKAIARSRRVSLSRLIADIDATHGPRNLSSAIRVFVLKEVMRNPHSGTRG